MATVDRCDVCDDVITEPDETELGLCYGCQPEESHVFTDEMGSMEAETELWMERAAYGLMLRDEVGPEAEDMLLGYLR